MQKFLIIIKFLSVRDFLLFSGQFTAGQVFLPSSNILPDQSRVLLKILVPQLDTPLIISGQVVSASAADIQGESGMRIDIAGGLKSISPEIIQEMGSQEPFKEIADIFEAQTDAENIISDEMSAPEDKPEHEPETETETEAETEAETEEDDLNNLRMENEPKQSEKDVESTREKSVAEAAHETEIELTEPVIELDTVLETAVETVIADTPSAGGVLFEDLKEMLEADKRPRAAGKIPEADTQYDINTKKISDDICCHFNQYANFFTSVQDAGEAMVYLKSFRRIVPGLIDAGDHKTLMKIIQLLNAVPSTSPFRTERFYSDIQLIKSDGAADAFGANAFATADIVDRPLIFIFYDAKDKIKILYENQSEKHCHLIEAMLDQMGFPGLDIFAEMLTASKDREIRKRSFERMIRKRGDAKKWAVRVLEDPHHSWLFHKSAILVLEKVGSSGEDFSYIKKFLEHQNPKIREVALNAIASLKPHDGESLILKAMEDAHTKVRWRAFQTLQHLSPISEAAMNGLLQKMAVPLTKDKEVLEKQIRKTVYILSALNAMADLPISQKVETEILQMLKSILSEKHSLWNRSKGFVTKEQENLLLKAAIPVLGKIGGKPSISFLHKKKRSHPELSEMIDKILNRIQE